MIHPAPIFTLFLTKTSRCDIVKTFEFCEEKDYINSLNFRKCNVVSIVVNLKQALYFGILSFSYLSPSTKVLRLGFKFQGQFYATEVKHLL